MAKLTAAVFQKQLGTELAELLEGEFTFLRSGLKFRRPAAGGEDIVILSGSSKWSPFMSVSFYFGRSFDRVRALEKKHGESSMPYHIQQYSPNVRAMRGIEYQGPGTWEIDIGNPPPNLAREILASVRGIAEPFFARFSDLRAARDAVALNDSWCFGGRGFWRALLRMDAALDDLGHFREWSKCLGPFETQQAAEMLATWDRHRLEEGRSSGCLYAGRCHSTNLRCEIHARYRRSWRRAPRPLREAGFGCRSSVGAPLVGRLGCGTVQRRSAQRHAILV